MFNRYRLQLILLAKRLLLCFLAYTVSRWWFAFANSGSFSGGSLLNDLFHGLRFDAFSIAATNGLFIVLSLLPATLFFRRGYQRALGFLFIAVNLACLALNFIDAGYFHFIRKRSTTDLLDQLGGQSDIVRLLPAMVVSHWSHFVAFAVLATAFVWTYRRIVVPPLPAKTNGGRVKTALAFLVAAGLVALALRGGVQRTPIDVVNAGAVAGPERAPIVLNTPFTVIRSFAREPLRDYNFFAPEKLDSIYCPVHHFKNATPRRLNLVVLLLESFAKEYTQLGGKTSYTPFFDSLMQHSLVYTNAVANAVKSVEGVPAVLSSMPSLMENPLINSQYANIATTGFAGLLGAEGYETAFFHGGTNGTMNFTEWAAHAGYRHYYGRDEYANDDDFDGRWGIWDEPFLQFTAQHLTRMREPFHAAVFTLSSHHPYRVPEKYAGRFRAGALPFEAALRYADHSLKQFFATASRMPWFRNTLFVLTADHAILHDSLYRKNPLAAFRIPVAFYLPDGSLAGTRGDVFGQADILPQTLALLGYNKPFFAFGKDPSKRTDHLTAYYKDGFYYTFTDSIFATFKGPEPYGVYNFVNDSGLTRNRRGQLPVFEQHIGKRFRALIQVYNHAVKNDRCTAARYARP